MFNLYVTLRATPFLGDELEKYSRLIFGQMRYVRNLFLQVGFLLLHSGGCPRRNASCINFQLLPRPISKSFPYFGFLLYPFPPARSQSSFSTLSLGNLFLGLSHILSYHFCSENEPIPKFRQFQGRWTCATWHSFENFLNLCYFYHAL